MVVRRGIIMLRAISGLRENLRAGKKYNVVVVGGGITGAAASLACARRGWSVLVVDQNDLAPETSANSTGLLHGGARYAEELQFRMVLEGIKGRQAFREAAPHLVRPFSYCVPALPEGAHSYRAMQAGRWLYDLTRPLGLSSFPAGRTLTSDEMLAEGIPFEADGFKGGSFFWDGMTDDHRLALEVLSTAASHGAHIISRLKCTDFLPSGAAPVEGVVLRDQLSSEVFIVPADRVVNAAGPWADDLLKMSRAGSEKHLRLDAGSHLIVRNFFDYTLPYGFFLEFADKRLVFLIPYRGNLLIGTTSEGEKESKEWLSPAKAEVDYLLAGVNAYFPRAKLTPADVIFGFTAHRPLFDDPDAKNADSLSRRHAIRVSPAGVVSVFGGKITPALLIGEEVAQKIASLQGWNFEQLPLSLPLFGGGMADFPRYLPEESKFLAVKYSVEEKLARYLILTYGTRAEKVLEYTRGNEEMKLRLSPRFPAIAAQVAYAVEAEMAFTLTDVLSRRIRLERQAGNGLKALGTVGRIMSMLLGTGFSEMKYQERAYRERIRRGRVFELPG